MRKLWCAVVLGSAASVLACSKGGPSEGEIQKAVAHLAKEKGYRSLTHDSPGACGYGEGSIGSVTNVEVTQRGEIKPPGTYVPLKLKIHGKCMAQTASCGPQKIELCPPEEKEFTSPEVAFVFKKDEYGGWTVRTAADSPAVW